MNPLNRQCGCTYAVPMMYSCCVMCDVLNFWLTDDSPSSRTFCTATALPLATSSMSAMRLVRSCAFSVDAASLACVKSIIGSRGFYRANIQAQPRCSHTGWCSGNPSHRMPVVTGLHVRGALCLEVTEAFVQLFDVAVGVRLFGVQVCETLRLRVHNTSETMYHSMK